MIKKYKELSKKSGHTYLFPNDLVELVEKSLAVIKALSLQLHHRLSERIY